MGDQTLDTRRTLLARLREGEEVSQAWQEFEGTYRNMLLRFCLARGLQLADAEDVVQQVFTKLLTGLRRFEYDPAKGRFRDYLFRCVRSVLADEKSCPGNRPRGVFDNEHEPASQDAISTFEKEWVDHHYRLAVEHMRRTCTGRNIEVFEAMLAGRGGKEIAQALSMTLDAVYKVEQRTRQRLRSRIAEQIRREETLDV